MVRRRQPRSPRSAPQARRALKRAPGLARKTSAPLSAFDALEEEVLSLFRDREKDISFEAIAEELALGRARRKDLRNILYRMVAEGLLALTGKNRYQLNSRAGFLAGTISMHPKGFAFASVTGEKAGGQDLFIPPHALAGARHGDQVLLAVTGGRGGRSEARVVKVVERGVTKLVGVYVAAKTAGLVVPDDERLSFSVVVKRELSCGAKNGEAVLVELTDTRTGVQNPAGRIVKVLGDPQDLGVQTTMVILKYELPHEFSDEAMAQAESFPAEIHPGGEYADLRDVPHVTIDGEDARDFDDAVAVEKTPRGFRLHVSIADVSHYVEPGSPIDQEAYARGTSVYFPNRVVPMLPERLSNNLCSLVPNEDRYAFTAILEFDKNGRRKKAAFTKSVIRSRFRLTYNAVHAMTVVRDEAVRGRHQPVLGMLDDMVALSTLLENQRRGRGSIGFELPEARVELSSDGKVAGIFRRERLQAHKLIEEFMLAANEAVAEQVTGRRSEPVAAPFLYRVHEPPDLTKVNEFRDFASGMGIELPEGEADPAWFGAVLDIVKGKPTEYIINNLLLRVMKQACYRPENVGHFGLAAADYCHFTSPIRRYPDLIAHRVLADLLTTPALAKKSKRRAAPTEGTTPAEESGLFLSRRERIAVDAEREMADRLKVRFMAEKVGETFRGIVSGASAFALFVELLDWFVSGAVSITELTDDYYHFDERRHRMVGRRTSRVHQIGHIVTVEVLGVDFSRRHVNFRLLENHGARLPEDPGAGADHPPPPNS